MKADTAEKITGIYGIAVIVYCIVAILIIPMWKFFQVKHPLSPSELIPIFSFQKSMIPFLLNILFGVLSLCMYFALGHKKRWAQILTSNLGIILIFTYSIQFLLNYLFSKLS